MTPTKGERALHDLEVVFTALAHASRRQILLVLLYRDGEMSAGEIADRFSCSWPTTTRHLSVLRDAGLIDVEKQGRNRVYRLNRKRIDAVAGAWVARFRATE